MRELASVAEVDARCRFVYVEPHLDDAVLSCGGQIAQQSDALVVSVFAGSPDLALTDFARMQHARWGSEDDAIAVRLAEQREALEILGADWLALPHLDAIYRGDQYLSDDDLFGQVKADDAKLVAALVRDLRSIADRVPGARWYAPLAVGNHVDHQLVRDAATSLQPLLWEDFPYAASTTDRPGGTPMRVDIGATLERKIAAVACYRSQLPVIFRHWPEGMSTLIRSFAGDPPTERYYPAYGPDEVN